MGVRQTDSDTDLARRAVAGDQAAADELFRRLWPRIRATAYAVSANSALADEIAQDSLEILLGRIGEFRGDAQLKTWVTSIVVNRARNVVRHERRSVPTADVGLDDHGRAPNADGSDPAVVAAVRGLSADRREVVALRYWLDLNPPEIAIALGIPVGTVHSRLSRAMSDLRSRLEVSGDRV